ncbi:tetr bacterial regulatory protein hth signature [Lucifera butyrica]|uniref:Tetr bacterial regulatory protein hth signature n=1 Tax=Lucifera butyrica TaxID=1351585 RepID=A0A498RE99_9FIRM|nr:helix-turn-helix domain-containing protein [Lucifera butyrica]VBB08331.1 tetr bacterial regulatory protein hth signature [Lucifera butyrica]VBB08403.1 tetr bacterial regulatory protein hth signature [Lucifera butyrica]
MSNNQDKKLSVIHAAMGLIIENGISELTTAKIAEQAETAETVIYRYFKNKQDILQYCIQAWK